MNIWAIADLHLSFGLKGKEMDVFGEEWKHWTDKISTYWKEQISAEDLVLIPGDISWAMHIEEAVPDLEWIDDLPGVKVMIKGNHDYWWSSKSKVEKILPPSVHIIQNDSFQYKGVSVAGARLWDTPEYGFGDFIIMKENKRANLTETSEVDAEKIFQRELMRLETSLKALDPKAELRLLMTHYPPIGADLKESQASCLIEKHNVDICVFGHLHSLEKNSLPFGYKNGVRYLLTSCDYLDFHPLKLSN